MAFKSSPAEQVLPFVQLHFSHAVGAPVGTYVVAGDGPARALISEVVEAPAHRLAPRRREAPAGAERSPAEEPRPVALSVITLVEADRPLAEDAARTELDRFRAEPERWAERTAGALAAVNVAARAFRTAAADPYLADVAASDPRDVVVGYGRRGAIGAGSWLGAFVLPRAASTAAGPTLAELRVLHRVAGALDGRVHPFEAEDLALRALADLDQGRLRAAAAQAAAAAAVLRAELAELDEDVDADLDEDAVSSDSDAIAATARAVLGRAAEYHTECLEQERERL